MKWLLIVLIVGGGWVVGQDPTRVPDDKGPGHYKRADGQACRTTGTHPCACHIVACLADEQGNVTDVTPTADCQWHCTKAKCSCHVCPQKSECPP